MASEIKVDTISEKTAANGVTIDGVLIKDSKLASGTGNVLQVVSKNGDAAVTVNSTTYTALVSVSITPSSTSSKILLIADGNGNPTSSGDWNRLRFFRDSTEIGNTTKFQTSGASANIPFAHHTLDSPSSTSAITYSIRAQQGGGTMTYGEDGAVESPTITAIEVGG